MPRHHSLGTQLITYLQKDCDLRVCLNPRNLNCALIRNIHYTASCMGGRPALICEWATILDTGCQEWLLDPKAQVSEPAFRVFRNGRGLSAKMDGALVEFAAFSHVLTMWKYRAVMKRDTTFTCWKLFNPEKCTIEKCEVEYFSRRVSWQCKAKQG